MKRVVLTLSLLLATLSAGAWNRLTYSTILTLASMHLDRGAANGVKRCAGGELASLDIANEPLYLFTVDASYRPVAKGDGDAMVVAERSFARLKADKRDKEALLSLAKAVADMHAMANLRIEGNDLSYKDFAVRRWNNRKGKMARYSNTTWVALWNSYYAGRYSIFTPRLYAEDTELFNGKRRKEFSEGNIATWAADVGREGADLYARGFSEGCALTQECVNELEYTHDRLMAKAAYRLATLLNEVMK